MNRGSLVSGGGSPLRLWVAVTGAWVSQGGTNTGLEKGLEAAMGSRQGPESVQAALAHSTMWNSKQKAL